MISMIDPDIDY